jgi:hypothetical protein
MTDRPFAPEPAMPLCHVCGKPMRLEDYGERLAKYLGLVYDEGDPARYAIRCCGYELRVEDEAKRREAVRLLRLYHQSPEQK